jgi:arylsulfatase A-like enzyme
MWHAHNYYPEFLWRNGEKVQLRNVVTRLENHRKEGQRELTGLAAEKVDYTQDLTTEEALRYIDEKKAEPFFLFLCYTIPHANNEAPKLGEHGLEVPSYGIYAGKEWPEAEIGKAAMITLLDTYIGQILAKLKLLDLDENTLVLFTSDNGPHKEGGSDPRFFKSSGPLLGHKRDLYEGGIRVPLIARWPGRIAAGSRSDHVSAFWDILPTMAELAGGPALSDVDGISMLPAILGRQQTAQHEYLYWEFHEGSSKQAVRLGDWKAVRNAPSKPVELYNLATDIGEKTNVADRYPDIASRARDLFETARTDAEAWPLKDKQDTIAF